MPKIKVNNIKINYETIGQGPDLVMIHGIASSLAFWYFSIIPLLKDDFRITIYDLRGHGNSEVTRSNYTSADMAVDLDGLLDSLGIEKVNLVGHSFGGLVALHYAYLYPERLMKLAVADTGVPAVETHRKNRAIFEEWVNMLQKNGIVVEENRANDTDYLIEKTEEISTKGTGSFKFASQVLKLKHLARLVKETTLPNDFRVVAGFTIDKLKSISHPILAMYGDQSPSMDTCRYLSANLKNCKAIIIPGVGHSHPLEKSEFFAENVREFILDK